MYALMWFIIFKIELVKTILATTPYCLLLCGGLAYYVGIAFFPVRPTNEIFTLCMAPFCNAGQHSTLYDDRRLCNRLGFFDKY